MTTWQAKLSAKSPQVKGYEEFEPGCFEYEGINRVVYKSGKGPAIIVIHEIPGIYDKVFDFARRLNKAGYTTYLPSLVGEPGRKLGPSYEVKSMAKLCVSKEFNRFALGKEAPIAEWLRALARHAHTINGGPGVGAVGMCFSGGFALAMMADESVIAPVLSQPSMPFSLSKKHKYDCDVNKEDIPKIKQHMEDHDICLLGVKFSHDVLSPNDRFKFLKDTFGDRFEGINIDSSPGNPHSNKRIAHSVLTRDFVDEKAHPTYQAFEKVLALFKKQLKPETV
jgi:dienelactone hydrolase